MIKTLGNYEILKRFGKGQYSEVFEAKDLSGNARVAIKVLSPSYASQPDSVRRFEREAKALSRISHPNIIRILNYGHEGDLFYYVMEKMDGKTLAERIHQEPPLTLSEILDMILQIAEGLQAAHDHKIIHRDIKPSNILFTESGTPKIADFGLAKIIEAETLSTQGQMFGSPSYMSPEQTTFVQEKADHRSDLFSLGAIFYEMLTRKRAFTSEHLIETLQKVAFENPPPCHQINPSIDPELNAIVFRLLEKKKEKRPESAQKLAEEIRMYLLSHPENGKPRRSAKSDKDRLFLFIFLALSISLIFFFLKRPVQIPAPIHWAIYSPQKLIPPPRKTSAQVKPPAIIPPKETAESFYQRALHEEALGQIDEAIRDFLQGISIQEKEPGQGSLQTGKILYRIGTLYRDKKDWPLAAGYFVKALAIYEKRPEAEETAPLHQKLGECFLNEADYPKAREHLLKALDIFNQKSVEGNPKAKLESLLGFVYYKLNELQTAENFYLQSLARYENISAPEKSEWAGTLNNLGILYKSQNRLEEAKTVYLKALEMKSSYLEPSHPNLILSHVNMALLYYSLKEYALAETHFLTALDKIKKYQGENCPDLPSIYNNLGILYQKEGKLKAAEESYLESLDCLEKLAPGAASEREPILINLIRLYENNNDKTSANVYLEKLSELKKK